MKIYTVWSEDQHLWFPGFVTASREKAEEAMLKHVKDNDCDYWIKDGLINIVEAELKDFDQNDSQRRI